METVELYLLLLLLILLLFRAGTASASSAFMLIGFLAGRFISGSALVFAIFSGSAFMGIALAVFIGMFAALFATGAFVSIILAVFPGGAMLVGMLAVFFLATTFAGSTFMRISLTSGIFFLAGFSGPTRTRAAFIIRIACGKLQAMAGHFGHLKQFGMSGHLSRHANGQRHGGQHFFKVHE